MVVGDSTGSVLARLARRETSSLHVQQRVFYRQQREISLRNWQDRKRWEKYVLLEWQYSKSETPVSLEWKPKWMIHFRCGTPRPDRQPAQAGAQWRMRPFVNITRSLKKGTIGHQVEYRALFQVQGPVVGQCECLWSQLEGTQAPTAFTLSKVVKCGSSLTSSTGKNKLQTQALLDLSISICISNTEIINAFNKF